MRGVTFDPSWLFGASIREVDCRMQGDTREDLDDDFESRRVFETFEIVWCGICFGITVE